MVQSVIVLSTQAWISEFNTLIKMPGVAEGAKTKESQELASQILVWLSVSPRFNYRPCLKK